MSEETAKPTPATVGDLNLFALLSLILSVVGFHLVGIIFGHISLAQLKRAPQQQGRGLAIAGLIVGYAAFALVVLAGLAMFAWMMFDYRNGMGYRWT